MILKSEKKERNLKELILSSNAVNEAQGNPQGNPSGHKTAFTGQYDTALCLTTRFLVLPTPSMTKMKKNKFILFILPNPTRAYILKIYSRILAYKSV